jgi:two-component system sensor histidine kinase VicK
VPGTGLAHPDGAPPPAPLAAAPVPAPPAPAVAAARAAPAGRLRRLMRRFAGIEGRMVILLLLVILMAMLMVSTLLLQQLQTYYVGEFTNSLTGYAVGVARSVTAGLQAGADQAVNSVASTYIGPDPQESVVVLDRGGRVVGTSAEGPPAPGTVLATDARVAACLNGSQQVSRWTDPQTRERLVGVAVPVLSGGTLVGCVWARGTLDRVAQTLSSIREILLRTTAAALAAVAVVTLLLGRTITGPLAELTARAAELAAGRFDRRIQVRGDDEIGALASMFNHMSQRLQETLGQISAEKRKADAILAHMADGIVAAGPDGTVGLVNPAAARLLAVGPAAVGRPLDQVLPPAVVEAIRGGGGDGRAVRVDPADSDRVLIARIAQLRAEDGAADGWVVVLADATEQERLNAQRREFVANVSHELRTPLTAIKSYAESLADGALGDPETGPRFLGVILAETDRMVRLISDLLQLTELEPRRAPWRPRAFRVEDVGAEAVRRVEGRIRSRGLTVRCEAAAGTPDAWGDPDRILQVLSNLLGNAVDFTPAGGRITISVGPDPDGVACVVRDTGVGIPAEDLPHVFERLYRVEASRAREHGGTGLGLAIAKEIVEAHGGEIRIESAVGEGTAVTFTLPAAPPAAPSAGSGGAPA